MGSVAVVNASPLIFLAAADALEFLRAAADEVLVLAEVLAHGDDDAAVQMLRRVTWLAEVPPAPVPRTLVAWDLGAGETAVLAAAVTRPAALVILDDAQARRCARSLGLPLRGTLGLVLGAKRDCWQMGELGDFDRAARSASPNPFLATSRAAPVFPCEAAKRHPSLPHHRQQTTIVRSQ